MRVAVLGLVVVAGLVASWLATAVLPTAARAERLTAAEVSAAGLQTHCLALGEQRQQVVVVDPQMRVIGTYQIDANGEIALKSVRNIHWDLQMTEFNTASPLPRDVRAMHQK
jgi:hypothetical protein